MKSEIYEKRNENIFEVCSQGELEICRKYHVNYYGSNMTMRTPVIRHMKENEKIRTGQEANEIKDYMVCGSLCTFADIPVRGLPEIYLREKSGNIRKLRPHTPSYEINSIQPGLATLQKGGYYD